MQSGEVRTNHVLQKGRLLAGWLVFFNCSKGYQKGLFHHKFDVFKVSLVRWIWLNPMCPPLTVSNYPAEVMYLDGMVNSGEIAQSDVGDSPEVERLGESLKATGTLVLTKPSWFDQLPFEMFSWCANNRSQHAGCLRVFQGCSFETRCLGSHIHVSLGVVGKLATDVTHTGFDQNLVVIICPYRKVWKLIFKCWTPGRTSEHFEIKPTRIFGQHLHYWKQMAIRNWKLRQTSVGSVFHFDMW